MGPKLLDLVIYEHIPDGTWELSAYPWKRLHLYRDRAKAFEIARSLAKEQRLDLWHTTDFKSFRRVAVYRSVGR